MANRVRHIGKIVTFTPPSVLSGIAQLADIWGDSSTDVHSPEMTYMVTIRHSKGNAREEHGIKTVLREDARKIGRDISCCIERYAKTKS